jgi:hypothetical protein
VTQTPEIARSRTEPFARRVMRESLLADLDARIASAGGVADYVYTTPRADLDRMLRRATIVSRDARVLPGEDAAAHSADERVAAATRLLETEARCRDLVARDAVNRRGKLAYDIADDLHAITQKALAARLAYHEAKVSHPDYMHGAGFDHLQAATVDSRHLLAQQLDAYDRGLEVVPSTHTQFLLGQKLHHRITRSVMLAQGNHRPGWQVEEIAGRLAEHEDYLKDAVDEYREFRRVVPIATDHGIYPHDVPEYQRPDWDEAARVVDSAVDQALGRPPRQQGRRSPSAGQEALARGAQTAVGTPACDAYLDARAQAGAVGMTLADPRLQRALELAWLQQAHGQLAGSPPDGYGPDRKPPLSQRRERAGWQRHQPAAHALAINAAEQKLLRAELGPDSEKLVQRALELVEVQERILAETPQLQRKAIDEEIAREPEWLTETLGPRPEVGVARWQTLAGELAAHRLRFAVADDADPGVRPEQSLLADKVAWFRAEAGLERSASVVPAIGLGM